MENAKIEQRSKCRPGGCDADNHCSNTGAHRMPIMSYPQLPIWSLLQHIAYGFIEKWETYPVVAGTQFGRSLRPLCGCVVFCSLLVMVVLCFYLFLSIRIFFKTFLVFVSFPFCLHFSCSLFCDPLHQELHLTVTKCNKTDPTVLPPSDCKVTSSGISQNLY